MRVIRAMMVSLMSTLCLVTAPAPVSAHGVTESADLSFAQTLAGNELTVVIRRTPDVPGPLRVDVIAHSPISPTRLLVGVRAADGTGTTTGSVDLVAARPGVYPVALTVSTVGEHVLDIRSAGEHATMPFRILLPRPAVWEWLSYGGFAGGGALILGALVTATISVSRAGEWWRRAAFTQATAAGLILVIAVTAAGLSGFFRPMPPAGAPPADPIQEAADGTWQRGRPYANASVHTAPAGADLTVRTRLTDGATGRPVDDLSVHHAALAHTVVVSADGGFFRHVHPIRVAPGELAVRVRPDRAGRYLVFTEFERQDSGAQLVSGSFTVPGRNAPVRKPEPPVDHRDAELTTTLRTDGPAVAGRPVTMTADVRVAGAPATDLQPWLGMAGHLILVSPETNFFGHVHELRSMADTARRATRPTERQPDETVPLYGPRLEFTYTFDRPGRYFGWVQFAREFRLITVPFAVTVRADSHREEKRND